MFVRVWERDLVFSVSVGERQCSVWSERVLVFV